MNICCESNRAARHSPVMLDRPQHPLVTCTLTLRGYAPRQCPRPPRRVYNRRRYDEPLRSLQTRRRPIQLQIPALPRQAGAGALACVFHPPRCVRRPPSSARAACPTTCPSSSCDRQFRSRGPACPGPDCCCSSIRSRRADTHMPAAGHSERSDASEGPPRN